MIPRLSRTAIFLLVLLVRPAFAQQQPLVVSIDSIPSAGFDLDRGWRFSPVDRPEFARPDFDDSRWDTINPTGSVTKLPQLKGLGVGWLRLHFTIGDSLSAEAVLLTVQQSLASELYLDGKLIKTYGRVSADPAKRIITGVNLPPIGLDLTPGEHVLAVRIAVWPGAYFIESVNMLMKLTLHHVTTYDAALRAEATGAYLYVFLASVFFLLSLLHLSFFKHDSSKRANLYFSAYTLLNMVGFIIVATIWLVTRMPAIMVLYLISFEVIILAAVWLIEALVSLYGYRLRRMRQVLWLIFFIFACALAVNSLVQIFGLALLIFIGIHIWLTIKALRERRRGAGIIAIAFGISGAFLVAGMAIGMLELKVSYLLWNMVWGAVFLSPALGISIYLSREFALDSKSLREKLVEVETLSARTLVQEQEKQQLLANQNETLEVLVAERTAQLNKSLENLKTTQTQLIQTEKMASLGELTAGIAHEIQNPLNFVNNFSEVNIELLDELKDEAEAGNIAEVATIADDLQQNMEKISYHGKRADSIVKSMLQHSRASSGAKEPTDLNALIDEYLRLSYHGIRAKDKSFNAALETNFDRLLPAVSVVPQDIGRVLLNLFTNAFQATAQRQKELGDPAYKPHVIVATKLLEENIEITVEDNGAGIPDTIKEKIFQPFFTTKPTGEGTGLGLSLSYDILVKGHNGFIELLAEGEGTKFRIKLPVS